MLASRYLCALAALLAAAAAAPEPRQLQLADMMKNTTCAMEVVYDENVDRVPRVIKTLRCLQRTDQWCKENDLSDRECCNHSQNRHVMECVEMIDTVAVYNSKKKKTEPYDVPVGCVCRIGNSTLAAAVAGPPGDR